MLLKNQKPNYKMIFIITLLALYLVPFFAVSLYGNFVIRDEFTKVYDLNYGETALGSVSLYNPTDTIIQIKVSGADYAHTKNEEDYFLEPGKYTRSNANWINFSEFISIRPKENATYPFTIVAPNQRNLVGSYWSVLFFEEVKSLSFSSNEDIAIDYRYCIQIITNLKNTGIIDMSFVEANFLENNIILTLKNTGTLWFDATIKIDIFNQNAEFIYTKSSERHRIYPELEREYKIPIDQLKPAEYYAIIMVDGGNERVFGHQISFAVR